MIEKLEAALVAELTVQGAEPRPDMRKVVRAVLIAMVNPDKRLLRDAFVGDPPDAETIELLGRTWNSVLAVIAFDPEGD